MNREKKPDSIVENSGVMAWTNILLFITVLVVGGLLSLTLSKMKISESEKRALTAWPQFSVENLFLGDYTDSLDLYYADNFPFRDGFVDFSGWVKESFGYRANDMRIYTTDQGMAEEGGGLDVLDSLEFRKADSLKRLMKVDTAHASQKGLPNSILIYRGMAFQIYTASTSRAIAYSQMINKYREVLDSSVRVFSLVAPTATDFYLPMELKNNRNLEGPNIQIINENLDSRVHAVDAYHEIESHKDEYLYFHTDHHWTGRGAYYAYRAFCESAGFDPVNLSAFKRRVRQKFLGSLYDLTKDRRLGENPDSLESFRLPIQTETYRFTSGDLVDSVLSSVVVATPNYTTFLGGDHPLIRIETEIENGRRGLVIKDSYGNAVCPFIAMHYKQLFVVDYRHFEKNLLSFIRKNKIDDVIFLHNTFVSNSDFAVKKETYLMYVKDKKSTPVPVDTMKQVVQKEGTAKNDSIKDPQK